VIAIALSHAGSFIVCDVIPDIPASRPLQKYLLSW